MQIQGKSFLVSGGSSGLGAACARALVQQGGSVVIADVNQEAGQGLAFELGDRARFVRTDVTDEASVMQAVATAVQAFGGLHGSIQCAGIAVLKRVLGNDGVHPLDLFVKVINVNLIGTFNVVRLAAQAMINNVPNQAGERGVIINTSSVAAFEGGGAQAAYAASKGGVASLTLPLAREFARHGIRVMAIAAGLFDTPLLAGLPEQARMRLGEQVQFPPRLGRPEEFAALARHIIENEMLNGAVLRLDGAADDAEVSLAAVIGEGSMATASAAPVFIERGEDPRVLVIAFSGFGGQLMMKPFDFFQVSGLLKYSRILLRDDSNRFYLGGVETIAGNFAQLLSWLRDRIRELAPEKVLAIGTSAGATSALLVGHELNVDYTHAFSPHTFLNRATLLNYKQEEILAKHGNVLEQIWALPAEMHRYFDLAEVLKTSNGITRHNVHVCVDSPLDVVRARHVVACPNVSVFGYPCSDHFVSQHLAQQKRLLTILSIENQENVGGALNAQKELAVAE